METKPLPCSGCVASAAQGELARLRSGESPCLAFLLISLPKAAAAESALRGFGRSMSSRPARGDVRDAVGDRAQGRKLRAAGSVPNAHERLSAITEKGQGRSLNACPSDCLTQGSASSMTFRQAQQSCFAGVFPQHGQRPVLASEVRGCGSPPHSTFRVDQNSHAVVVGYSCGYSSNQIQKCKKPLPPSGWQRLSCCLDSETCFNPW